MKNNIFINRVVYVHIIRFHYYSMIVVYIITFIEIEKGKPIINVQRIFCITRVD